MSVGNANTKGKKMIFQNVYTPYRKRNGRQYGGEMSEYKVNIQRNKSITVYAKKTKCVGMEAKEVEFTNTFEVGDVAEFDSFNLHYTGIITKITDRTVTIKERDGRNKRLNLYEFCFRNYDFDAKKIAEKNHETMMHI